MLVLIPRADREIKGEMKLIKKLRNYIFDNKRIKNGKEIEVDSHVNPDNWFTYAETREAQKWSKCKKAKLNR